MDEPMQGERKEPSTLRLPAGIVAAVVVVSLFWNHGDDDDDSNPLRFGAGRPCGAGALGVVIIIWFFGRRVPFRGLLPAPSSTLER